MLITSHLGNVIWVTFHHHGETCSLKAQAFQLHLQREFIPIGNVPCYDIQANHLHCVVHHLVENDSTGLVTLNMVLHADLDEKFTYYILQVTTHAIKMISKFNLPYEILPDHANLTDGPNVVWLHGGNIFVYNATDKLQKVVPRYNSTAGGGDLFWSGMIGTDLVTIGRIKEKNDDVGIDQHLMSFPSTYRFIKILLRGGLQKSFFKLIPDVYADIVTVVNVCDDSVIICTKENQLISFQNGKTKNLCRLPFKDAVAMDVAVVAGGKKLIVISSRCSEVCCVWSNTFEIAASWNGISRVLVDDFYNYGSDQILLLSTNSIHTNIFTGFMLTDLLCYNIKEGDGDVVEDGTTVSQNNLTSAVRALQKRMQVSVAAVKQSRIQLTEKVRMIHQSHKALVKMATDMNDNADRSDQMSLVCLYDGLSHKSMSGTNAVQIDNKNTEYHPSVSSPWQRLVGDEWIVAMEVENTTRKSIQKLAISLIHRDSGQHPIVFKTRSSLYVQNKFELKGTIFEEPVQKRLKPQPNNPKPLKTILHPTERAFICAVTKLPSFVQSYLVCNLVLHWKSCTEDMSRPLESIGVGSVSLTASDVAKGDLQVTLQEFCGELTDHEEITLNAVQLQTTVNITSQHSNISQLDSFIQTSFKFLPIANNGLICTSGAFSLCRIYITVLNAKSVLAEIYTRDEKCLHLLVHSLQDMLPDDVIITPTQSRVTSASKNALDELEKEITTKLKILTTHKFDDKVEEVKDDKEKTKSVEEWRKAFVNEQMSTKCNSSTKTIDSHTAVTMEIEDLKRKVATDNAFMEFAIISDK
ncbi:Fanconi anemia group B protein-like [Antedon mediterranea]|uniref:Fanconi anemia group B protein-like n=1 Tax=Antedon mediterranea TaxID=105859 RepID=UPI003AF9A2AC